jgi:hypothetical protein
MLVELLARTPTFSEIGPDAARVVGALRHWVVAGRGGACPIAAAGARLGSARAGAHLHLLIEEIGAAWPDPFAVAPPCCPRLSHDEAALADMVALAGRGDRPGFDRLLADLIPADERERLFLSAQVLSRQLQA